VKYGFILGMKELLLKSISQTNTYKKEMETNKQKKEKNQNQAYTRVDVDLIDS